MTTPVVAIVGPTATGKTRLGIAVAQEFDGEIINADSLQVYRGLEIGTAKPTTEERGRVPHHLVDILDPEEPYSCGEFNRRARTTIEQIESRDRLPVIVGGSGLYIRSLLEGISPIPSSPPQVREEFKARLDAEGLPALRRELEKIDPETAARLTRGDTQRVLRALEVHHVSGRTLSYWIARQPFVEQKVPAFRIGLTLPRAILYDRISIRVARMVKSNWVGEVKRLLARGDSTEFPAFQAIGYRQIASHLAGELGFDETVEDIVRSTRRFAKRQLTWFRKDPRIQWFDARGPDTLASAVIEHLRRQGLGGTHG